MGDFTFLYTVWFYCVHLLSNIAPIQPSRERIQEQSTPNYDLVMKLATQGQGEDQEGYRGEFMRLVEKSRDLMIRK